MRFDIRSYIERFAGHVTPSGRDHVQTDCPLCGKAAHLYVNTATGAWDCKKCGEAGGPVRLIAELEKVSLGEARRILASQSLPYIPHLQGELREALANATQRPAPLKVDVDLPPEYVPCWDGSRLRVPVYLRERGVGDDEIKRFRLGYCERGRYAGRVVFPVVSLYGRSFTTRLTLPGEPRYLAGDQAGRLIFGWDVAVQIGPPFVLCEGPMDALGVYRAGYAPMALMGKSLRRSQLNQLKTLDGPFILVLDEDANQEVFDEVRKLGNVSIGMLPQGDPASVTTKVLRRTILSAAPQDEAMSQRLRSRLAALRPGSP